MSEYWYPKAVAKPQASNGGAMVGGPPRGVIHTLEGGSETYGAPYYGIQLKDLGDVLDRVSIVQWRPFNVAAKSLVNGPDPVQTNRQGSVCVQACIIGYAENSQNLSPRMVYAFAELLVWCEQQYGLPATSGLDWCGGEGYGTGGKCRMSISAWKTFSGWCGHQHVPDNNKHWDPGRFPWDRIETAIRILKGDTLGDFDDVPKDHPQYDDIMWAAERGYLKGSSTKNLFYPDVALTRGQAAAMIRRVVTDQ